MQKCKIRLTFPFCRAIMAIRLNPAAHKAVPIRRAEINRAPFSRFFPARQIKTEGDFLMVKILAIGNSFSQDATRYLYPIAQADGTPMKLVNLCIGGCSLERHFRNVRGDLPAYAMEFNSASTGLNVSVKQLLVSDSWDFITLQQVSQCAPKYETYQPYLGAVADEIRYYQPKARLLLHQTWAYEQGSARLTTELGYTDQAEMFRDVEAAYAEAARAIHADGIIPSGMLFQRMLRAGFTRIHRDTFHADLGFGRYALAALWFDLLTGRSVTGNPFRALDVPSDDVDFPLIQRLAHELADEVRF